MNPWKVLLGSAIYAAMAWTMGMVLLLGFSLTLTDDPTYCHPPLQVYEYVFPARPLACLVTGAAPRAPIRPATLGNPAVR